MLSIYILIACVIVLIVKYYWSRRHFFYASWKLPGEMAFPLIGTAWIFWNTTSEAILPSIKNDLLNPPPPRLISRSPIWTDIEIQDPHFNVQEQWKRYWNESPGFSKKHLIQEPHHKLEGFNLPRREWKMLNRFRSGRGCSGDQMHRWRFRDSTFCDCGNDTVQSMDHILNECALRKFNGNIQTLHIEAVSWLSNLDIEI